MAKHEYFIDETSKKRCTTTYAKLINARDIPPVFSLEKGQAIRVFQKEDIDRRERKFSFLALIDDETTSQVIIEDGTRFMTSELASIICRDNMFPIALTWKTPSGDTDTLVCISYTDEATIRFNGTHWSPVGPMSAISINSNKDRTGDGAAYRVFYNQFLLNEVFGARIHGEVMIYLDPFGINWLASALEYRYDYIEKAEVEEQKKNNK